MKVKVISVLEDNYMYLVIEENTREAIAVDATVPQRLLEIVKKEGVKLTTILTTHHHWDHSRGNEELVQLYPGLRVYGADERIGALTHKLSHNEELKFGAICVRCLLTPGHTLGHMCYFMWEDNCPDAPAVFSGDALLIGGCGRLLEGTAEQMYQSLNETLGTLPKETKVFCGHEYTVRNLKFALKVEPDNETVKTKLAWAKARDDDDIPTVPSTLGEEFHYNPFLRAVQAVLQVGHFVAEITCSKMDAVVLMEYDQIDTDMEFLKEVKDYISFAAALLREESVQKYTGKKDPVEVTKVLHMENDNFKKPSEPLDPRAVLALEWGLLGSLVQNK